MLSQSYAALMEKADLLTSLYLVQKVLPLLDCLHSINSKPAILNYEVKTPTTVLGMLKIWFQTTQISGH